MALQPCKHSDFPLPAQHSHGKRKNGFSGPQSVDARWTEAVHMDDNELEEGEACDDPDSGCDPDTAFSYLDEKLLLVLGDVQKEFEGGVSAEKLGSKFGGYGSFLPTHERAPSILHDQRPAVLVPNDPPRAKKSPSEGIVERIKRAAAVGVVNDRACAGPGPLSSEDGGRASGPVNEKMGNAGGTFPATKAEENSGHKKKVTLRIKMGSDANARKKNTSIYSDFGLNYSSSASLDDDDDDQRSDSDVESSPDRTPLTMIRIMTSHQLPEGLLSPLPELVSEPFLQEEKVRLAARESQKPKLSVSTKADFGHDASLVKVDIEAEKVDSFKEKIRESVSECKDNNDLGLDYGRKVKKEEPDKLGLREAGKNISKHPTRALGKDSSKLSETALERQERDCVSESGTGVMPFEIPRDSKRSFRDKGVSECPMEVEHTPNDLGSPYESLKEVESSKKSSSRGSKADKGTSHFHDSMKEQLDVLHRVRDPVKEVSPFNAGVTGKKQHDINGEPVEGKKRSGLKESIVSHEGKMKGSKDSSKSSSKNKGTDIFVHPGNSATTRELVKEEPESKKKVKEIGKEGHVSRGSSGKKTKEISKEAWKSSGKDTHLKETAARDKEGRRDPSRPVVKDPLKDLAKEFKKEALEPRRKEKVKEEVGAEPSSKDLSRFCEKDRQKELAVLRDVTMKATDSSLPNMQHAEANGHDQPTELGGLPWLPRENRLPNPAVPAHIITENWVCCDKCETWRLLPPGVEVDQLPKKWSCKMLDWLPGMNNCRVSEEETRIATQALYTPMLEKPPTQLDPLTQPASVLPGPTSLGHEAGITEKTKAISGKKRKVFPTVSNEFANTITKMQAAAVQINQDGIQGRLGSEDSVHVQVVEEKRRSKEREKKRTRGNDGASPLAKENGQTQASIAIKEAKDLKHHADRLKGKERESIDLYLRAALKFLHAAAMMESAQAEGAENGDPLAYYADTAKLCKFCAVTYERNKEMAAAALAYKCAGLAHMRVVQAKSLCAARDRAELHSAHQQVPPGDSPCLSIAPDLDNLNNLSIDRFAAKGAASPCLGAQTGGNLILPGRCRSIFNRILQYVGDTNAAVEALSKSSNAFAIAEAASHSSIGVEGMVAVKRVMEFGFHDVESMLSLVRIAMDAIGH